MDTPWNKFWLCLRITYNTTKVTESTCKKLKRFHFARSIAIIIIVYNVSCVLQEEYGYSET